MPQMTYEEMLAKQDDIERQMEFAFNKRDLSMYSRLRAEWDELDRAIQSYNADCLQEAFDDLKKEIMSTWFCRQVIRLADWLADKLTKWEERKK